MNPSQSQREGVSTIPIINIKNKWFEGFEIENCDFMYGILIYDLSFIVYSLNLNSFTPKTLKRRESAGTIFSGFKQKMLYYFKILKTLLEMCSVLYISFKNFNKSSKESEIGIYVL